MPPEPLLVPHDQPGESGQLAEEADAVLVLAFVVGLATLLPVVLAVGAVLLPLAFALALVASALHLEVVSLKAVMTKKKNVECSPVVVVVVVPRSARLLCLCIGSTFVLELVTLAGWFLTSVSFQS